MAMREETYFCDEFEEIQSIENSPFQVFDKSKSIYFVQTSPNQVVEKFISSNREMINERFEKELLNSKFIPLPQKTSLDQTAKSVLRFYIPSLFSGTIINDINPNKYFFDYINYTGSIRNAFVSLFDDKITIVEFDFGTEEECLSCFDEFIINRRKEAISSYISSQRTRILGCPMSRADWEKYNWDRGNIELDEEARLEVKNIEKALSNLRESGNLIAVLPIIESFFNTTRTTLLLSQPLSPLKITEDYKMFLPGYNNMEIKMSHLTKSIYLLFLACESVDLRELKSCEEDLMEIYKIISNQENYDKMLQSVKDVVDLETNAIYVHLSRIKSAFCSKMDSKIAENYYVDGKRNEPKEIKLSILEVSLPEPLRKLPIFDELITYRKFQEDQLYSLIYHS